MEKLSISSVEAKESISFGNRPVIPSLKSLLLSPDCSSQPTPPQLTFHSRFLCFWSGYFGASGDGPVAT